MPSNIWTTCAPHYAGMPVRLELSRKAQADLDDIRDYSVGQFGPLRTIEYIDAIERTFRRILAYPDIGAAHAGLSGVRSLPSGEHRPMYCLTGSGGEQVPQVAQCRYHY